MSTPAITPNPTNALGGPVIPPNLPVTSGQAPQSSVQAQPPAQPTADDQKHMALGRGLMGVIHSLEGKQVTYQPDPNTGQAVPVVSQTKPGQFFRNLLAGTFAASAAASQPLPAGTSPLVGFARGAQAGTDARQQAQEKQRMLAQQQAQQTKAANDSAQGKQDANTIALASIANDTASSLNIGHHIGLHSQDEFNKYNNAVNTMKAEALKAGGQLSDVDGNGQTGNGPAMMKLVTQDPKVLQGPDGFHRIPFIHYDTSGEDSELAYKNGKWVDAKTGEDPDWNDHATVTLVDLPNTAWGKNIVTTKGTANSVAGRQVAQGKDTDSVQTTFGSLFGLGLMNKKDMIDARATLTKPIKKDSEYAGEKAKLDAIRAKPSEERSEDEDAFERVRGPIIDKYKPKEAAATPSQIKQQTEQLNLKLNKYAETGDPKDNLTQDERALLVERQREAGSKGVPDDIINAIGPKPVPAMFDKGEKDPAYLAASKLWGQSSLDKKTAMQAASGLARYQMLGQIRDYNITNTTNQPIDLDPAHPGTRVIPPGEMGRVTANEAAKMPPGAILNTQDGTKIMAKGAAVRDIQYNIDNTKRAISALDDLDASTRAKLIVALRDPDPSSSLKNFTTGEAKALLDVGRTDGKTPQADAVQALQSMAENVMLLRSVQGVGGAGSDMMRHALQNLIPGVTTPSKGYALKQMDLLQRTLDQLKTGVPTVGGQNLNAAGGTNKPAAFDASKLQNLHTNGTVTIGWDGKQWVDSATGKPYVAPKQ